MHLSRLKCSFRGYATQPYPIDYKALFILHCICVAVLQFSSLYRLLRHCKEANLRCSALHVELRQIIINISVTQLQGSISRYVHSLLQRSCVTDVSITLLPQQRNVLHLKFKLTSLQLTATQLQWAMNAALPQRRCSRI